MVDITNSWEGEIASLLGSLAGVQRDLLDVLADKRRVLATGDLDKINAVAAREAELIPRLQACQERRQELLSRAASDGLPADSIRSLTAALPASSRGRMRNDVEQAQNRTRFLQSECLTNWVLVQQMLLHLSQLIEIIATGGQRKPTYGNGSERQGSGFLVDRAA
jgi:flagellar biosynthesis/type III secretory pathway chaperone